MASHGTLTLGDASGLSRLPEWSGGSSVLIVGTQQALNTALNGLTFTPAPGYSGWADVAVSDL